MKKISVFSALMALWWLMVLPGCGGGGGGGGFIPLSSSKAITAFSLDGVAGTINEVGKTIAVTMPYGTNVTALVPAITHTGASVSPASGVAQDFTSPVTYTVTAANGSTQAYRVTVTVASSSDKAISAFSLDGVAGTINEAGKTIAVTLSYGTSVTGLVATFTTTGASVKVGSTVQVSGTTTNDFTNPVTYTVTAADSSTQDYIVTVTVAPSSAKAITAFSLDGFVGTINEAGKTIAVSVTPEKYANRTALVATFSKTGASVKVGDTLQVSGTTPNDFTNPVIYAVTAADATTQDYTVTVTPKSWGTAALIEADAGNAGSPQIAINTDGNAVAVWQQDDGGDVYSVWSNRYTASTGLWGAAELIEDDAADARNPQIAIDASGNAVAVWSQDGGGSVYSIWSKRYTAGTGWGIAELIEAATGPAYAPQIAIDADGNAVAVWYQHDGTRYNIWSNRYTAGTGWGTAELIETDNVGTASAPQIASDADGNAVAVWHQDGGGGIYSIWSNRYTAGTGWGTAELIEAEDAGEARFPQIAVAADGNAVAVWHQDGGDGVYSIWSNRYTAGTGWGTAELIEAEDARNARSPQVAIDADGNATAVWRQSGDTGYNICSNRYTAGTGWGEAELIEADAGDVGLPQIATDAAGNAVAVWYQHDGTRNNIWSNRFTASTGIWGTAALIEAEDAGDAIDPQIAIDANCNAVAVWSQNDSTRYNIWSNIYR